MSRDAILARRARFIAAALAALGAGACSQDATVRPCLSPVEPDAGDASMDGGDGSVDGGDGSVDAADADAASD